MIRMYAKSWKRMVAFTVDGVILLIGSLIIFWAYGFIVYSFFGATDEITTAKISLTYMMIGLIFIMRMLYYGIFHSSSYQATPGKKVVKIIVTDLEGRRIPFLVAIIRYCSKYLSTLLLCVGYVTILLSNKKQGLHDMIAKSIVVENEAIE